MKTIRYTLTFFSDWHCGAGLSAGADVDALVVKDRYGLPYVPGRTIKGLLREQVELVALVQGLSNMERIDETFGAEGKREGTLFVNNAQIPQAERDSIVENKLTEFLYRTQAFTAIDDMGIAKDHSLRKMEVVVPCALEGTIEGISDELYEVVCKGLKLIKRLGTHRSRGLGRCEFTIKEG